MLSNFIEMAQLPSPSSPSPSSMSHTRAKKPHRGADSRRESLPAAVLLAFQQKKASILSELQSSEPDLSPKGEPDKSIIPLIELLNSHPDIVTTSSCSGRLSVFLEGSKKDVATIITTAVGGGDADSGNGGGGGGDSSSSSAEFERGRWLYSSHEPVDLSSHSQGDASVTSLLLGEGQKYTFDHNNQSTNFELSERHRLVHFKFEPMIMHILASNTHLAQRILGSAITASFRESGISGSKFPMVGVRTNGLMFDSPIGVLDETSGEIRLFTSENGLEMLVELCNMRFKDNARRTKLFEDGIRKLIDEHKQKAVEIAEKEYKKMQREAMEWKKENTLNEKGKLKPEDKERDSLSLGYLIVMIGDV